LSEVRDNETTIQDLAYGQNSADMVIGQATTVTANKLQLRTTTCEMINGIISMNQSTACTIATAFVHSKLD
jgi:hypothetical protein